MTAVRTAAFAALVFFTAGCATATGSPQPQTRAPQPSSKPTSTAKVDPAQAERLQRVMIPLIKAMNDPIPLNKVRVGIVADSRINAASGGNGEFYVTTGLLEKANDDQLAGVLAHEVAHDDLRHVAKAQTLGAGLNIGVILLDALVPGSGAITPIAGELIARSYSRNEEYAADKHGMALLERTGQNPKIMESTLTWLMQTAGSGGGGFFSTHPNTGDRIEALRNLR